VSDRHANPHGLPTYDWPRAPFPKVRYPFVDNEKENREEEERCVAAFEQIVQDAKSQGKPVGAAIMEPISYFKNAMATPLFYRGI